MKCEKPVSSLCFRSFPNLFRYAAVKLSMKEKLDLKEMMEGIEVESGAGILEFALKSKVGGPFY
jgi:hypothetical protein